MAMIAKSYPGLGVLLELNWDRALYFCTIVFGLCLGAYLGTL